MAQYQRPGVGPGSVRQSSVRQYILRDLQGATSRSICQQELSQRFEKLPGSSFALGHGVVPVQQHPLLGEDHLGRCSEFQELDSGDGHRDAVFVGEHFGLY
jgi:hypothetical protein